MSTTSQRVRHQLGGRPLGRVVFSAQEIRQRVEAMGAEISASYPHLRSEGQGEVDSSGLLVLGLLKGSFIFMADLVRQLALPVQVDFLVASSYGAGTVSSGDVKLVYDPDTDLTGRDVLLVEDIVDSGHTLNLLLPLLQGRGSRSLEVCALLHKKLVTLNREPRWVGFEAPEEFLVGYGLDHSESLRHLPFIASI